MDDPTDLIAGLQRFTNEYPAAIVGLGFAAICVLMAFLFVREVLGDR